MFDTHCHLTDLDDSGGVLREAVSRGVSLLCCAYDAETCHRVAALRSLEPQLLVAFGLHPWFADQELEPVIELIEGAGAAAVGEIGLDLGDRAGSVSFGRQREVLEVQLETARRLGLPVTLHARRAVETLTSLLKRHRGVRGVLHAFSGSTEQARLLVDMGFLVGVGGAVTRRNARSVRRTVSELPLEAFVLETDCPAIGMEGLDKELVRPWDVVRVASAIAELKSISVREVEQATDANARRLFVRHG